MKQLTKEELQGSQLGILSYIDKICKENNIKPILFTAMPCEVAESHMITVF